MANKVAAIFHVIGKTSTVFLAHDAQTLLQRCFCAFAKLLKATVSFIMSVCPSVRMEQLSARLSAWSNCLSAWNNCLSIRMEQLSVRVEQLSVRMEQLFVCLSAWNNCLSVCPHGTTVCPVCPHGKTVGLSVRMGKLSVRMEQLSVCPHGKTVCPHGTTVCPHGKTVCPHGTTRLHWTISINFDIWLFFENLSNKFMFD
jgi:hypothetical protein